jgi:hypothetical protein
MEQVELLEGGAALAGELGVRVPDPAAYDVFAPLLEPLMGSHSGHSAKLVHGGRFGHGGYGGRGGHGGQARDRHFNRYIFVMCFYASTLELVYLTTFPCCILSLQGRLKEKKDNRNRIGGMFSSH